MVGYGPSSLPLWILYGFDPKLISNPTYKPTKALRVKLTYISKLTALTFLVICDK